MRLHQMIAIKGEMIRDREYCLGKQLYRSSPFLPVWMLLHWLSGPALPYPAFNPIIATVPQSYEMNSSTVAYDQ